ncbi:MAG: CRISPR system precrRNA processing endoribonuclease RAMP protein Cas6 [Eubacteriales bacterium]|nr:CRISPR system precrRNA processing endoribonuclease RAMP protein Cas6 [Eubacteriales bacterium]
MTQMPMTQMLPGKMEDLLRIRYVKLHFTLEILQDGCLPQQKASALRGGMGRMLLMTNCIRDENCSSCDFEEDCLVRRMMYPKMQIRPQFMTGQDSEGYVLECENREVEFREGDELEFNLLLFGRTIVYFNQFLQAFYYLGMQGLGAQHIPFRVKYVTNTKRQKIVEGTNVYKEYYQVRTVEEYVRYRLGARDIPDYDTLVFHSPLSLKYRGEVQEAFSPEAILAAAERRIYILNCYEGRLEGEDFERPGLEAHIPRLVEQRVFKEKVKRFSGTHNASVSFYGIRGSCRITGLDETARILLIAGELIHIGKNTSFGFGRYTLTGPGKRA